MDLLHEIITNPWVLFIVFIFIIFFLLIVYWQKKERLEKNRNIILAFPSWLSTSGVLGTFIGITIGLLEFDTNNLDKSIPELLDGLKTAFFTSLAGMFGSIFLSWYINYLRDKRDNEESKKNDPESILRDLKKAIDSLFNKREEEKNIYIKQLQSLEKAIVQTNQKQFEIQISLKDEFIKIVSLAEKGAEILSERLDKIENQMISSDTLLGKRFDEFSELLKKSNTEALVEVMKGVTQEFQSQMNNLISKLIQENFSKLNDSVENLNNWQQENKYMISNLTEQYKEMTENFSATSTILSKVGNDTEVLLSSGGKLNQIVNALNQVIVEDKNFIETSENLRNASQKTEENMKNFTEVTTSLNDWIKKQRKFVDGVQLLIEKLDEINKIRDYNESFWKDTKKKLEEGVNMLSSGTNSLNEQLKEIDQHFYNRLNQTLENLDACIQAMVKGK